MKDTVRDAATVIVLRERDGDVEALMLRRHGKAGFAADAWVFPGGVVDEADSTLDPALWRGIDPSALAGRFQQAPATVLGAHVAAVRETFEEAGLLVATHRDGTPVDLDRDPVQAMRRALVDRDATGEDFARWLAEERFVLELGRLAYWSRWVTPRIEPRRYDTAFFLARAPEGQAAHHDRVETTDQRWVTPQEALDGHRAGTWNMIHPTIRTLEEMVPLARIDALFDHAAARPEIAPIIPHFEQTEAGWRVLHPGDPEFPVEEYRDELAERTAGGAG